MSKKNPIAILFLLFILSGGVFFYLYSEFILMPKVHDTVLASYQDLRLKSTSSTANHISNKLNSTVHILEQMLTSHIIVNPLMHSDHDNPGMIDYLSSFGYLGETVNFYLYDINADILYQEQKLDTPPVPKEDVELLLKGKQSYVISLFPTTRPEFITVGLPVKYMNNIEGVMIAEIRMSSAELIGFSLDEGRQAVSISTPKHKVDIKKDANAKYHSHTAFVPKYNLKIDMHFEQRWLDEQKHILFVELYKSFYGSALVAFLLFAFIGYRKIVKPFAELTENNRVLESTMEGIIKFDEHGNVIFVNTAMCEIFELSRREIKRSNRLYHCFIKNFSIDAAIHEGTSNGKTTSSIWEISTAVTSERKYLSVSFVDMELEDSSVRFLFFSDVTAEKISKDELIYNSTIDALTEVANRAYFNTYLQQIMFKVQRQQKVLYMLFVDLDGFKQANDNYGHSMGDAILIEFASRMKTVFRKSDFIARLGGDEFGILIDDATTSLQINHVLDKLKMEVERPMMLKGRELYINASIGISSTNEVGYNQHELLQAADMAMYKAKKSGCKGVSFYSDDDIQSAQACRKMLADLENGIDNDKFSMYLQPIFDLHNNQLAGFETLLRWKNVDGDIVCPDLFVPILEDVGLIHTVGLWVLEETIKYIAKFDSIMDRPLTFSCNVSPIQLGNPEFVSKVLELLDEYQINPSQLQLELTEICIIEFREGLLGDLTRLRERGIKIAIDDFGTGYSTMNYIMQLPLDTIKIDKSFIDNIETEQTSRFVIQAMLRLAEGLDLKVIVEGVESLAQKEILQEMGALYAQGYYYHAPMSINEVLKIFEWESGKTA